MALSSKVLQWGGLLALAAFAGTGVVTWGLVKDRLDITISKEPAQDRVDPVALLRDEVGVLREDVRALSVAVTKNFELLAGAGEESNQAVEAAILERLDLVEQRLGPGTQAGVATHDAAQILAELRAAVAQLRSTQLLAPATAGADPDLPEAHALVAADPEPVPRSAAPAEPGERPGAGSAAAVAEPPAVSESSASPPAIPNAPPQRKRRGFLAFELPSSGFEFDRRQRFEILSSLSRVGFDAKSTLHDFSGVTSEVRGQLVLNLAKGSDDGTGTIRVDAASLRTGVEGRDDGMWEHLDVKRFPDLQFELRSLVTTEVDPAAMQTKGTLRGSLSIRGKARDVEMPVQISVDDSRRVLITGEMPLNMTDYEVPVPNQAGLIKVEEVVKVWISLRARSLGQVTEN